MHSEKERQTEAERLAGNHEAAHAAMIRDQLVARGVRDPRVLEAMRAVPRHAFVPRERVREAYADRALPIGYRQTISQPLMVARVLEVLALRGDERVLEVGAGSGYLAALLGTLAADVVAIESVGPLAESARDTLTQLGVESKNGGRVRVVEGDGSTGFAEAAPYDAIVVSAAAPAVPPALVEQLSDGGRLVVPVGDRELQTIVRIQRLGERLEETMFDRCSFVPLLGAQGWNATPST